VLCYQFSTLCLRTLARTRKMVSFLGLAPEVRIIIYELLTENSDDSITITCSTTYLAGDLSFIVSARCHLARLFPVCQQLLREASDSLYKNSMFEFPCFHDLLLFLRLIGPSNRSRIGSIQVYKSFVCTPDGIDQATESLRLLDKCSGLVHLFVTLAVQNHPGYYGGLSRSL
jgi:hypothetical protein